jgi:hypothetical protein
MRTIPLHSSAVGGVLTMLAAAPSMLAAADITFFSWSDPHYEIEHSDGRAMVQVINGLPGTDFPAALGGKVEEPRGILIQGDLIDDGARNEEYPVQWANYTADFGVHGEGRCRFPVFDGVGNHDLNPDLFVYKQIAARNQARLQLGLIRQVSENGYHYSWDWEDIHFVQLNLFCGDHWHGEADTYGPVHDPMLSREFLIKNLRENVGTSGRPVVVIQHYRPIDENWWTHLAADGFHQVLQDYNVILILVGHQGGGPDNTWRGIHWTSSNSTLLVIRITADNHLDIAAHDGKDWRGSVRKTIRRAHQPGQGPTVIHNGDWATEITPVSATLGGKILHHADPQAKVWFYWGTSDGGSDPAAWQHSRAISPQPAHQPFHLHIDGLQPWTTYHYRCAAVTPSGTAWAAASIPFETRGHLPDGWESTFVGHPQRAGGGAHHHQETFTLRATGRDIGEGDYGIDNFQFAFQPLDGNGSVSARITSLADNAAQPRAGVMIREGTAMDARNVSLTLDRSGNLRWMNRVQIAGRSAATPPVMAATPVWLRITREGDTFTASHSADGQTWQHIGDPLTLDLAPRLSAGLAATAGNRNSSSHHTSTFDHVRVIQHP